MMPMMMIMIAMKMAVVVAAAAAVVVVVVDHNAKQSNGRRSIRSFVRSLARSPFVSRRRHGKSRLSSVMT